MKYYFIFFLILFSLFSSAQETNQSQPFQLPSHTIGKGIRKKNFSKQVIGEIDGNCFTLEYDKLLGASVRLHKYDHLLNPVKDISVCPDPLEKKINQGFYTVIVLQNKLVRLTSSIIKRSNEEYINQFKAQYINPNDLNYEGQPIIVESVPYHKKQFPHFLVNFSPDSSKIGICSFSKSEISSQIKATVKIVDKNFNTIWSKEVALSNVSNRLIYDGTDFRVDNNGNLFIMLEEPEVGLKKNKNKDDIAYNIYCFIDNGKVEQKCSIINPNNKSISISDLKSDSHNYLYVLGEYSGKDKDTVGIYYQKLNLETGKTEDIKRSPINKYLANSQHNSNGLDPSDFILKSVVPTSDSGYIFLFEHILIHKSHGSTVYTYGDILALRTDKNAELLWEKIVPKFQHDVNNNLKLSYQYIYLRGSLYLVFNEYYGANRYFDCITRLANDGTIQQEYLFNNEYFIIPADGKALGDKMFLFVLSKKTKEKALIHLIKLDFDILEKHGKAVQTHTMSEEDYYHKIRHYEKIKKRQNKNDYFGVIFSYGANNYYSPDGTASVNFAYAQTDVNKNITTNQVASFSKKYSSAALPLFGLGIEYLNGLIYAEGKVELNVSKESINTNNSGYGNAYLGVGVNYVTKNKKFGVRAGVILLHNHIFDQLGRIDNYQKNLNINGDNGFQSTFTITNSQYYGTYNADYSQVVIDQTNVGIAPKLGLEYLAKNKVIIYRLNIGYNHSISNQYRLEITQYNEKDPVDHVGHYVDYTLNNNFLNYHYSGSNKDNVPYNPNNFFINFELILKTGFYHSRRVRGY